jgi:hypothetical protein
MRRTLGRLRLRFFLGRTCASAVPAMPSASAAVKNDRLFMFAGSIGGKSPHDATAQSSSSSSPSIEALLPSAATTIVTGSSFGLALAALPLALPLPPFALPLAG